MGLRARPREGRPFKGLLPPPGPPPPVFPLLPDPISHSGIQASNLSPGLGSCFQGSVPRGAPRQWGDETRLWLWRWHCRHRPSEAGRGLQGCGERRPRRAELGLKAGAVWLSPKTSACYGGTLTPCWLWGEWNEHVGSPPAPS